MMYNEDPGVKMAQTGELRKEEDPGVKMAQTGELRKEEDPGVKMAQTGEIRKEEEDPGVKMAQTGEIRKEEEDPGVKMTQTGELRKDEEDPGVKLDQNEELRKDEKDPSVKIAQNEELRKEEDPGVKMTQNEELRKDEEDPGVKEEENLECPGEEDNEEYSELKKYNLKIPDPRSFVKRDEIEEYFDKLPWFFGALGRSLTLNVRSQRSPTLFAPINIPLSRRLQTFAVLFWMSSFLFLTSGGLALLLYLFFYTQYWWITLCYFTWYLADRSICHRGGRRFKWFREWVLWKHFRDFFPIHLIKTAELDPSKNYIMGYHPHGVLAAGAVCAFGTEALNFTKVFPGLTTYLSTLEVQFLLPFFREYLMASGAVSPSRESIDYIMKKEKPGQTFVLVIGGAKEALECHPGRVDIFLKDRKGFCKIALRYGASLVPVFSFGENDIYDQVSNPPGSLIRRLQTAFQKVVGFAPLIFFGRGVFQYGFGFVPFRKPMYIVVGSAIDVPVVKNPTQEEIDSLHASYVKALVDLYNKYRGRYSAYPEVDMKVI